MFGKAVHEQVSVNDHISNCLKPLLQQYLDGSISTLDLQEGFIRRGGALECDAISLLCATFLITDLQQVVCLTLALSQEAVQADVAVLAVTLLSGDNVYCQMHTVLEMVCIGDNVYCQMHTVLEMVCIGDNVYCQMHTVLEMVCIGDNVYCQIHKVLQTMCIGDNVYCQIHKVLDMCIGGNV